MSKLWKRMEDELNTRHESKTYNNIKILESPQGAHIKVNSQDYLNMCSNNYLGFANDKDVIKGGQDYLEKYGAGSGAVRSIAGSQTCHLEFEQALAKFKGVEDVILVQSGFQANTALIPTITTEDDAIISDELNHASIIDGVRLSKAKKYVYKHIDINDLQKQIEKAKQEVSGFILIITDGVFSMDGDIAPLDEIVKLKNKYEDVYLTVDDAHGEGVFGSHGRGLVNHFKLEGEVEFEIGTLSKAFGIAGGFIGGKKVLIDYLKQKARPFLFSTGIDSAMCGAGLAVVDKMSKSDDRVKKLWENAHYLQEQLQAKGLNTWKTASPITPVIVGEESMATDMTKMLFEENILVSPIMYPTVAKGLARIRLMPSATHSKEDLDLAISKIEKCAKELGII
ncbi:glycine C-acetyltransferase [Erysipelotrichaceae bacterium OttesenSCG-928-M19]|nr:glycine C-acetyltransferase [Erysipelotrichaceae bacterium OttesenSCG-928-M19]